MGMVAQKAGAATSGILGTGMGVYQLIKGSQAAKRNKAADQGLLDTQRAGLEANVQDAQRMQTQAQLAARQGFTPEQEAAMRRSIANAMDTQSAAISSMGGSRGQQMANRANLALTQGDALLNLGAQDAAMQQQNQQYANQLGSQIAQYRAALGNQLAQQYGIQRQDYLQRAQGAASMQGAALQNIKGGLESLIGGAADASKTAQMQQQTNALAPGAGANAGMFGEEAGSMGGLMSAGATMGGAFKEGGMIPKEKKEMGLIDSIRQLLNVYSGGDKKGYQEGGQVDPPSREQYLAQVAQLQRQRGIPIRSSGAFFGAGIDPQASQFYTQSMGFDPSQEYDYADTPEGIRVIYDQTGNVISMLGPKDELVTDVRYTESGPEFMLNPSAGLYTGAPIEVAALPKLIQWAGDDAASMTEGATYGGLNPQQRAFYEKLAAERPGVVLSEEEMQQMYPSQEERRMAAMRAMQALERGDYAALPRRKTTMGSQQFGQGSAGDTGGWYNPSLSRQSTELEATAQEDMSGMSDIQKAYLANPDAFLENFTPIPRFYGGYIPDYRDGGMIPSFAKGGKIPTRMDILAIGISSPRKGPKQKAYEGGKTEGGVTEPIQAEVVDKETGEVKTPVELHGQELVFDAETTTKMEELAKAESYEELGKLVAETLEKYEERDAKINDSKEEEIDIEEVEETEE